MPRVSRRAALKTAAALSAAPLIGHAAAPARKPRVAGIHSIYRFRSHAYHISGRFIHGYTRGGFHHQPPYQLARMYNHQYPDNDLSREVCARHKIERSKTVAEALGGDKLDVDAVLLIVEHGDYPLNEVGQILYPRYELFQEIIAVYKRSGRTAPIFVDKALSYDHVKAAKMVATAKEMGFPLMAGSSIPVTWRRPELELPLDTPLREGLAVFGYERGPVEIYFFHALEGLQCMMERRAGGETGVRAITYLEGAAVWKAGDDGRWSPKLLEAALARCPSRNIGALREQVKRPQAILLEYADGTRATVLHLMEALSDMAFAGEIAGRADPAATCFYLPAPPGARYFDALTHAIERFFAGAPHYPVERTLLTSTVLDLALHAQPPAPARVESPALNIRYRVPADSGFARGAYTDAG